MKAHIVKSINSYNEMRLHASYNFLTTNQALKGAGILFKRGENNNAKKNFKEIEFQKIAVEKV